MPDFVIFMLLFLITFSVMYIAGTVFMLKNSDKIARWLND
jgi:hypothetical protein